MTVDAIGSVTSLPTVTTTQSNESSALEGLDSDAFLQLLVAQLENQDPTEPMDSTEYMAQLASYANVEQNTKTNDKLDQVLAAVSVSQAGTLMGRTVTSPDGGLSGTVTGYEVYANGVTLMLDNGASLVMGPGVKVSGQ